VRLEDRGDKAGGKDDRLRLPRPRVGKGFMRQVLISRRGEDSRPGGGRGSGRRVPEEDGVRWGARRGPDPWMRGPAL